MPRFTVQFRPLIEVEVDASDPRAAAYAARDALLSIETALKLPTYIVSLGVMPDDAWEVRDSKRSTCATGTDKELRS